MNIPNVVWEGTLDLGCLDAIIKGISALFGRKGRLIWVDTE